MSKMHSTSLLSTPWPFWTGILSQVSKNDDEKRFFLKNLALGFESSFNDITFNIFVSKNTKTQDFTHFKSYKYLADVRDAFGYQICNIYVHFLIRTPWTLLL